MSGVENLCTCVLAIYHPNCTAWSIPGVKCFLNQILKGSVKHIFLRHYGTLYGNIQLNLESLIFSRCEVERP